MGRSIGTLRKRVTIEAPQSAKNTYGEDVRTWVTLATVWAAVEPMLGNKFRGREFFAAGERQSVTNVLITIRYRADVTTAHRITWNGKHYNIQAISNPDSRNLWLEFLCQEGLVDG